jgi:GT2 family glycosyltransferase
VVVPTRDTADLTLKCLATVSRAAGALHYEIILVDDGGRDGTPERARATYPHVRLVRHDTPMGFSAAANSGLRLASAPILLLLNSDTEVRLDSFAALTAAFEGDPDLGIAGAQLLNSDGSPQWSGGRIPGCWWLCAEASGVVRQLAKLPGYRRVRPLARSTSRDVDWVPGAALAMRKPVWEQMGPFDESFRLYAQDLDFCQRAGDERWKIRVLSDFKVLHHQGATIAKVTHTTDRQDALHLWTDLLRWSAKRRGGAYARRAALALSVGARARLLARWLVAPTVASHRRAGWSDQTRQIRAALDAIRGATQ